MNYKIINRFLLIYIIITSLFISLLIYSQNTLVLEYKQRKAQEHELKYKAIYNQYKRLSNAIFDADINTPIIIDLFKNAHKENDLSKNIIREKLFSILEKKYEKLKEYNLRQLHFHLPNNHSFLRMHRPKKFGDDLTNFRKTVEYVNKNQRYIDGFEEGRIFNGFRYVHPLFDMKQNHIGSVEISFSIMSFIETMKKDYNLNSNFIIRKDIVDKKVFKEEKVNYIQSPNKDFYFEKNIYEKYMNNEILDTVKKDQSSEILKGKTFTTYYDEIQILKTIIPIKNPITGDVVAAICICQNDFFIKNSQSMLYMFSMSIALLIAIILYLFHKQDLSKKKLKKLNKNLDKEIKIEIEKNRKKDLRLLSQSKMSFIEEVLNNIAHQWRQPLNAISTGASGLQLHKEMDTLDDKNFELLTNSIVEQTQYLSNTIDFFSDYINENDNIQLFSIQEKINSTITMIDANLKYNNIKVEKDFIEEDIKTEGIPGELSQIVLNILNNSKEALLENNAKDNRLIKISLKRRDQKTAIISIEDNAGGIPENILGKIFDPYFTTKHESIGTGIGLYMCYELIHKNIKGNLTALNTKNGVKFLIEIPL